MIRNIVMNEESINHTINHTINLYIIKTMSQLTIEVQGMFINMKNYYMKNN